jgi:SSS family solute:Na+ symporter
MEPGMIRLVVIALYMVLLLGLGYLANRGFTGTKKDYLLASHSIGPFLLLMSLFGTTMTAFALVGSTGEAFKEGIGVYGMLASSSGIIHSLCFFVIGVKIYGFGRKYGYTTQIQFFRDRLESDFVGVLLFPILVCLIVPYLLIGVMASGTVIQTMTSGAFANEGIFQNANPAFAGGLPPQIGSAVVCTVVLIYVFFGGMRGTAWANTFQTMVFMVLGLVTFVLIANKLGGGESLLESLRNVTAKVDADHATRITMSKAKFFTYMFIPLSVGMFPHLFQHWLTAKSVNSFKLSVVCHPIFIMIVWIPCVLLGIWATTDGALPAAVMAKIKPNAVLPALVKFHTTALVGGLLTAGILAAVMSSLDSQFLCLGSMFTNDIVDHYAGKGRISDRKQMWLARGFVVAIVVAVYFLSLIANRSVFTLGIWCFSGFASLFPVVFAALYWQRLTAAGAVSGIATAAATWYFLFSKSKFGADGSYALGIPFTEGIEVMPVVLMFALTSVAMVATSLLTRPPSKETLEKFFPDSK